MDTAERIRMLAAALVDIFGDGDFVPHRHFMEIVFAKAGARVQLVTVEQGLEVTLNSERGQTLAPFVWNDDTSADEIVERIRAAYTGLQSPTPID